jgi:hypothetical protein
VDALWIVFIVAVVLAIIMLVGHALWVVTALVFRGLFGMGETPRDRRDAPPAHVDPTEAELAEVARLQRQLDRLRDQGALEAGSVGRLQQQLDVYRRRVASGHLHLGAKASTAAQPPPVQNAVREEPVELELIEEAPRSIPTPARAPKIPQPPVPPPGVPPPAAPRPAAAAAQAPSVSRTAPAARAPDKLPQSVAPPTPPAPPSPPAPPRQRFAEILSGFMEERNIRWGELVGGLLFVGCSVALVISLWETLQRIPYIQFFGFVTVSAAMFGVGLYTYHRWKLESTSRGLLIIATLLAPLNFAVMARASQDKLDPLAVLLQIAALGIFVALVSLAARVLVGPWRWWMTVSVVGSSACMLLTRSNPPPAMFFLLAALPAACHGVPLARVLASESHDTRWDEARANRLFILLGTATFALVVALGLLVVRSGDRPLALNYLSVIVALVAAPITAAGLAVMRGTAESSDLAGYRTAGTSVALVGMTALVAALGLAWPQPPLILLVGALNAVALGAVAFRYRVPVAHCPAIACAAVVYLVAFHLLWGHLAGVPHDDLGPTMLRLAFTAQSGTALVGLFLILAAAAEAIARAGRRTDAAFYAGGCIVVAVVSLLLVTARGYTEGGVDALRALIVYGIYGGGSLALNARWQRPLASYVGLALLVCSSLWTLWWRNPAVTQSWAALVALESLVLAIIATVLAGATPGRAAIVNESTSEAESSDEGASGTELLKAAFANALRATAQTIGAAHGPAEPSSTLADAYRWPLRHVAEGLVALAVALAWFAPDLTTSWLPTLTAAALAASVLLSAWEYKQPGMSWVGSALVLAALVHAVVFRYDASFRYPWTVAFLAHATWAIGATLALRAKLRGETTATARDGLREHVQRVFSEPIGASGLASSLASLAVLSWFARSDPLAIAQCLFWLAALWLVLSVANRSPALFSAFQAVLAAAVGFSATHWLNLQSWVAEQAHGLADPRSLQTYGIALGALSLFWAIVRIIARGNALAQEFLDPPWPAVDRVIFYALAAGSVLLAAWGTVPEVGRELAWSSPVPAAAAAAQGAMPAAAAAAVRAAAFGAGAWWLVCVLSGVLVAALWDRWRAAEALAATALAICAACLLAGRLDVQLAVASALRWNLSSVLLLVSAVVWFRAPLTGALRGARCRIETGEEGPVFTRGLLWLGCVLPVLWLTARVAWLGFQRATPAGPLVGSWFHDVGPIVNNIVPLALIALALVGHAVRELSPEYSFAAGLVSNVTVAGGYALGVVTGGGQIDGIEFVRVLQLATLTAAVWAIGWLAARKPLVARRPHAASPLADPLLRLQIAQSAAGNLLLLVVAFWLLAWGFTKTASWTTEAGSPLGWIALVVSVGAGSFRIWQKRIRLRPETVGLLGMAALGLVACSIQRALPGTAWGYRALMLGWALYALSVVAAVWWAATLYTPAGAWGAPRALVRTAAIWVRTAGALAVLLGLKTAVFHSQDTLWAAAAIAIASAAGAAMAVWLRREGWAFTAGLGVNLAASLVAWHLLPGNAGSEQWWTWFVQANCIAGAAVAILWLAARRRLYAERGLSLAAGPLLVLQSGLVATAEACLVAAPLVALVREPRGLDSLITVAGQQGGWLAWALALAAIGAYVWQARPRDLWHVTCAFALAAGVLAACSVAAWREAPWLAYHTLTAAWTVAGALVLCALAYVRWMTRSSFGPATARLASPYHTELVLSPVPSIEAWLSAIGLSVVALAVRGAWTDPQAPYWSAGAVLAMSVVACAMAILIDKWRYVYASGLLFNVAGSVVWLSWPTRTPVELALVNAACFAAAGIFWTLLGIVLKPVDSAEDRGWPRYEHLATPVGLAILAVVAAIALAGDLRNVPLVLPETLAWTAWGLAAVAAVIALWDPRSILALAWVYASGVIGIAVELSRRGLPRNELGWYGGLALAAFVLVASIAARGAGSLAPLGRSLWLPRQRRPLATQWFSPAQAVFTVAAASLGVWISLEFADRMDRLGGALTVFLLLPAAVLTARDGHGNRCAGWEEATIAISVLALTALGCAWLEPVGPARWLHDGVMLLASAIAMIAVCGFGFARLPARRSSWVETGQRCVPALSLLALVALAAVLWQEWRLFEPWPAQHPMAVWAIAVVAVSLLLLVVACLAFAVLPMRDPFHLSDRGRTAYVYAAEVVALVIVGHFRLTVPRLFQFGIIENYWALLVMAVAFVGAGLAEFFERKRLSVLAEPLARTAMFAPLLPVVAILGQYLPMVGELFSPGRRVVGETVLFLVSLFYGFLAVTRKSFAFAALSVLAANTALWVLWHQRGIQFFEHPQLWLIPLALTVLVAEQINRGRLPPTQSKAIRYFALAVIYISSTADIFIARIEQSLFVPMVLVLLVLAVLGALVGIMLRVRSYLYLGVSFLLVDVCMMIYHATVDLGHAWVLWLSGVLVGTLIIALFAVFEKRRNDLLAALERFKEWE